MQGSGIDLERVESFDALYAEQSEEDRVYLDAYVEYICQIMRARRSHAAFGPKMAKELAMALRQFIAEHKVR